MNWYNFFVHISLNRSSLSHDCHSDLLQANKIQTQVICNTNYIYVGTFIIIRVTKILARLLILCLFWNKYRVIFPGCTAEQRR